MTNLLELDSLNDKDYIEEMIVKIETITKKDGTNRKGDRWDLTKLKVSDNSGGHPTFVTIWKDVNYFTQKWYSITKLQIEVNGKYRNLRTTKNTIIKQSTETAIPKTTPPQQSTQSSKLSGGNNDVLTRIAVALEKLVELKLKENSFQPDNQIENNIAKELSQSEADAEAYASFEEEVKNLG